MLNVLKPGTPLPRNEDGSLAPRQVTAGWAILHIPLSDGRRQVLAFVLPGDSVGLRARERPLNRVQAQALTNLQLAQYPPPGDNGAAACSLFGAAVAEESLLVDHIVKLGRKTAYERTIHTLLEIHDRLAAVGMVENGAFDFPPTQEVLADALGLSIVHVNRVLKQLRQEGMIAIAHRRLILLDRRRMQARCDYASTFLATSLRAIAFAARADTPSFPPGEPETRELKS